jgi:hypothetical protein
MAEFARVLHPGGHAVISNIHHLSLPLGGTIEMVLPDGRPVRLPAAGFLPADYINAALKAGFQIQACAELPWPDHGAQHGGPTAQAWCPEAARLAYTGTPAVESERAPADCRGIPLVNADATLVPSGHCSPRACRHCRAGSGVAA